LPELEQTLRRVGGFSSSLQDGLKEMTLTLTVWSTLAVSTLHELGKAPTPIWMSVTGRVWSERLQYAVGISFCRSFETKLRTTRVISCSIPLQEAECRDGPSQTPNAHARIVAARNQPEPVRGELEDVDPSVMSVKRVEQQSRRDLSIRQSQTVSAHQAEETQGGGGGREFRSESLPPTGRYDPTECLPHSRLPWGIG
jgi:hypothetical protein